MVRVSRRRENGQGRDSATAAGDHVWAGYLQRREDAYGGHLVTVLSAPTENSWSLEEHTRGRPMLALPVASSPMVQVMPWKVTNVTVGRKSSRNQWPARHRLRVVSGKGVPCTRRARRLAAHTDVSAPPRQVPGGPRTREGNSNSPEPPQQDRKQSSKGRRSRVPGWATLPSISPRVAGGK